MEAKCFQLQSQIYQVKKIRATENKLCRWSRVSAGQLLPLLFQFAGQRNNKECYFSRALQKFYSVSPYSYRKAVLVLGMINIEKVALDPTIFQQS